MGTCKYIMLTTNGTVLTDSDRHVTITTQNEHRGSNTRVSWIRQVQVSLRNLQITIGPGTEITVRHEKYKLLRSSH